MITTATTAIAQTIAVDIVGSFLYLPVWWYTAGLLRTVRGCARSWAALARSYGVGIWFRNLFVPMYGQTDILSRVISFVLRVAAILFFTFMLTVYAVLLVVIVVAWVAFPVGVGWMFVHQLLALVTAPAYVLA